MKYKVGDRIRVRGDLREKVYSPFGFTKQMAAMAGSIVTIAEAEEGKPDRYILEEDGGRFWWSEQMFEPVEQFYRGGIVPVIEQIDSETIKIIDCFNKETRYRWDGCKWNEVRDTPTSGKSVFKPMISALEKCIRLAVESEFGTKKSTGIESRKDIRKRLLKL